MLQKMIHLPIMFIKRGALLWSPINWSSTQQQFMILAFWLSLALFIYPHKHISNSHIDSDYCPWRQWTAFLLHCSCAYCALCNTESFNCKEINLAFEGNLIIIILFIVRINVKHTSLFKFTLHVMRFSINTNQCYANKGHYTTGSICWRSLKVSGLGGHRVIIKLFMRQ